MTVQLADEVIPLHIEKKRIIFLRPHRSDAERFIAHFAVPWRQYDRDVAGGGHHVESVVPKRRHRFGDDDRHSCAAVESVITDGPGAIAEGDVRDIGRITVKRLAVHRIKPAVIGKEVPVLPGDLKAFCRLDRRKTGVRKPPPEDKGARRERSGVLREAGDVIT